MTTAQLSPPPRFQAFDNAGLPLAGGLLYSYAAGTTTPQATYPNSSEATPNTNPVVLDFRGCANVWLDPTLSYKLNLTDALGNQIYGWPIDNIPGGTLPITQAQIGELLWPQTSAELAAGVTPSNYAYAPGNVLRYGADPTGTNSSSVAFTASCDVAMAGTPHGYVYIPAGLYLIPSPGLTWTNQQNIRIYGDGPAQSLLIGDTANGNYTILTISADTGHGTTGINLNLSNFGILSNNTQSGQSGLKVADYLHATLQNLSIQSSGNALVMAGMAVYTCINLDLLTWQNNTSGNSALILEADTNGICNGPGKFIGCQIEGNANVTAGGAICSTGTFSTTFSNCSITALGPSLVTVAEFSDADEVTLINCYSESSCNTTGNTAPLFRLGVSTNPVLNFTVIGGHFYNGNGTYNLKYAIVCAAWEQVTIINVTFANFTVAAMIYQSGLISASALTVLNSSAPGGAATFFDSSSIGAPSGSKVQLWNTPAVLSSGWGTPTNSSGINNFPGSSATLAQCGEVIGELIIQLQKAGLLGA